jgi:crotonobetainyl-CoA:carnitine CoA-transferase CaiB-like acyl-CoA transferase
VGPDDGGRPARGTGPLVSGGPLPGLQGLGVLNLSEDVAGAYCAKLLADAGATVTLVEAPEGHPLRRWSASGSVGADGDEDGVLFRFLASSQRSMTVDPAAPTAGDQLDALLDSSDVVIVSTLGDRVGGRPPAHDARAWVESRPELVVVNLSAFGLHGPRGGDTSSDLLLQALCGSLHSHGTDDREPLAVGGGLAEWTVGTFGALGAVSALTGRRRTGRGDLVDVSALECLALTFICYPSVAATMPGGERIRPTYVMVPGIERGLDGWVGMATITTAQWHTFLDMIERPDLAGDESLYIQRNRERPDVLAAIGEWTGRHTVDEVVETGSLYRIPTVPIGHGANFPDIGHVVTRQLYDPSPRGGFPHPRSPFRSNLTDRPRPGAASTRAEAAQRPDGHPSVPRTGRPFLPDGPVTAEAGGLPLEGVRVLDFTAFLAGPMATQYLASLGADVIKVESTQRPDPMRYSVRVNPSVDQWYEQGAIFQSANLNKRSVTLDLSVERGRLLALRLAATSDVVVENFTPRVMEQFGLSYDDLSAVNPRLIMVRMPGFGLDGPWRDRPGFAASMEQVSGLAWITGYADGPPSIPGICDPLAGMHSAFAILTALEHRARTGQGQLIELAMVDLAANLVVEQVLEHTAYGHLMTRQGNRQPGPTHQGVYACAEPQQWIAVRVATDDEWQALRRALGEPAWTLDPVFDTASGRSDHADRLDAGLGPWVAGRSQKEALASLQAAGVGCEPVVHSYDVDLDGQMNARAFWEEVGHPVVGPKRFPGWPMQYGGRSEAWFRRPAPLLGQHNDEVLERLGVSAEERESLRADGIIGTRPGGL